MTAIDPSSGSSSGGSDGRPESPRIGRYEIIEVLGGGGQGVVYKAKQLGAVERIVAVKTLRPERLVDGGDVDRFLDEMRRMASLKHDGLVGIEDSGIEEGRPFLVMPLLDGGSLARRLEAEGLPIPGEAAEWVARIARSVQHLHDEGMIHRDLKPSNILLDAQGGPKLADFGLVRLMEQAGGTASASAVVVEGTAPYMAPEQASGRVRDVGPRTDVYGLGAILYALLTGRPPFRSDTVAATLVRVLEEEPAPPRRLRPEIPAELEEICLKCLEKEPADRYRSAAELADELDRFRRGEPLRHPRPSGPLARLRRWAYREPGLAARLATVAACSTIMWANRLAVSVGLVEAPAGDWPIGPVPGDPRPLTWTWANQSILLGWGLASAGFQQLLNRRGWSAARVGAWLATDVTALTGLLMIDDALVSPLTVAYAVLIAASGLWGRQRIVAWTTAMALVGYMALVVHAWSEHQPFGFMYRHMNFLAGLAILGAITAYQVRRLRALGRFIEGCPTP